MSTEAETNSKGENASAISESLEFLLTQLDGLQDSQQLVFEALKKAENERIMLLSNFLKKFTTKVDKETGKRGVKLIGSEIPKLVRLTRDFLSAHTASTIIPTSLLVAGVSSFDAFLGTLVSACLKLQPELPNASEKSFTFAQLSQFSTLDEMKAFLIEKEIESCTSPDKTDTEIWLTNAVCYRSECCTAFKVASRHKRHLPTGYPPFIPFALLNYVTHSEKG
jgi:hypothetical protein